jgi:hypothetical protein
MIRHVSVSAQFLLGCVLWVCLALHGRIGDLKYLGASTAPIELGRAFAARLQELTTRLG